MNLKRILTSKLGLRNHQVRADKDIWLASYPRTGNTWIRALIASAIRGRPTESLTELDRVVPDRHILCPARKLVVDRAGPVIVKTHLPCFLERPAKKVIYIIREPLAVAWSFYKYQRKTRVDKTSFEDYIQAYVNGQIWPGCWAAHARGWISTGAGRYQGEAHVVRYEDLVKKDHVTLEKLLDFIGVDLLCRDTAQIYEWNSMKQLQAAEEVGNRGIETGWFIGGSGKPELDPSSPAAEAMRKFKERNSDIAGAWNYL